MDKYMIDRPIELCIVKYPGLYAPFIKSSKCYLMFMVYHAVVYARTKLWYMARQCCLMHKKNCVASI